MGLVLQKFLVQAYSFEEEVPDSVFPFLKNKKKNKTARKKCFTQLAGPRELGFTTSDKKVNCLIILLARGSPLIPSC